MYARMITTQARLGTKVQDQQRLIEQELLPLMRQQPGFRGYFAIADAGGKMISISLWDSEADNYAFGSQRIIQEINAKFQPLIIPGMGGADGYQVVIDALTNAQG